MLQTPACFDDVTSSSQTVKNILLPSQCALPWARQRPWGRVGHTVGPARDLLGGLLEVRGPPEEPPWWYLEVAAGPAAAKNDSGRRLSIPLPWRQSSASGSTWRHLGASSGRPEIAESMGAALKAHWGHRRRRSRCDKGPSVHLGARRRHDKGS